MASRRSIVDSPPPTLEWCSNDGSTRVSMPIGLADRVAGYVNEAHKSLPKRGAEAGGILLGGVRLGPVIEIFITGFEPIRCDYAHGPSFLMSEAVLGEFKTALDRFPAAEILGYYRSHTRHGEGLDLGDQDIVDQVFPGLSGLILVIKPAGSGRFTASYYFFQKGRLETRAVGPEFPFHTTVPGGTPPEPEAEAEEPAAVEAPEPAFRRMVQESLDSHRDMADEPLPERVEVASKPARPPAPPEPELTEPPKQFRRRKRLQWEIIASALMIAAALALLWWQYRGASGEDGVASQAAPAQVASLGLTVRPGTGGWRVTWDPTTNPAQTAVRGVLSITEDEARESIPLSPAQVRAGVANYRPTGNDIAFRLDLFTPENTVASETYRVVMKPPELAAAPAPKAATPPVQQKKKEETPEEPAVTDASFVEPEVLHRVSPEIPEGIRPRITSPIAIDVKVSIDREGNVTRASAIQHEDGLIDFLGKRAVSAARLWTFSPARRRGKPVESTRTIHFVFEQ